MSNRFNTGEVYDYSAFYVLFVTREGSEMKGGPSSLTVVPSNQSQNRLTCRPNRALDKSGKNIKQYDKPSGNRRNCR